MNGTNINATSITWKQRYFSDTHNRSVHFDKIKSSEMLKSSQPMFCLNNSELVTYIRKERYICMAHISINGRKQPISRTTSIEKHNIKGIILLIWNVCSQFRLTEKCVFVVISTEVSYHTFVFSVCYWLYFLKSSMIHKFPKQKSPLSIANLI